MTAVDKAISYFRDLRELDEGELCQLAREREVAYQDVLGEIERRRVEKGVPKWDEADVAAALALHREGADDARRFVRKDDLPPALFRMGYEWAAISLMRVLESVLDSSSSDAIMTHRFEPAGRGLWRQVGKPEYSDPRRLAAMDLLQLLDSFIATRQRGMFASYKRKRRDYQPDDDQELIEKKLELKKQELTPSPLLTRGDGQAERK